MWKKLIKGRQKAFFLILFFLSFFQSNLSWKFELTTFLFSLSKVSSLLCYYFLIIEGKRFFPSVSKIWTVKFCQKLAIFKILFLFHFVIIFYSLSSHPLPARLLFLIVLQYSREKGVICKVYSPFGYRITNHAFSRECFFTPLCRTIKNSSRAGSGREDRLEKIITNWKRNKNLKMLSFCVVFNCSNRGDREKDKSNYCLP